MHIPPFNNIVWKHRLKSVSCLYSQSICFCLLCYLVPCRQAFVDKKDASMAWLQTGEDMLNELLKFPGEDKSDEKLLMTVKMQKSMETQLNTLAWLVTESERLLGGEDTLESSNDSVGWGWHVTL